MARTTGNGCAGAWKLSYLNPAAVQMALPDRLAQDDLAVAVGEGGKRPRRRRLAGWRITIDGAKELLNRVGEALVVPAGITRERPCRRLEQGRIAHQQFIGTVAVT